MAEPGCGPSIRKSSERDCLWVSLGPPPPSDRARLSETAKSGERNDETLPCEVPPAKETGCGTDPELKEV